jgi:synaptobrevin family protein YKT6
MVKLFSLVVLYKNDASSHILKGAYDLSSFSFFQRGSVQEFMTFTSKILAERTSVACRQSVKEDVYMCHIYVRHDNLVGVCISDHDYPTRVAHTLITKILDDFAAQVPRGEWSRGTEVSGFSGPLDVHLKKYQDPNSADPMTKVQNELDETKIILHNTIKSVLDRGEKLDDLVEKSEGLSMQSKMFYTTAKKTNSCCASWS